MAKQGTKVLDSIYLMSYGFSELNPEGSKLDEELYVAVRHKVEAALWKPEMTKAQKLRVIVDYINSTNHYPGSLAVSKEHNPTFWKNWSIENRYSMIMDGAIGSVMILQGYVCDCTSDSLVMEIAIEDLKITQLKDETEAGEGVWIGRGEHSSYPANPMHETLFYRDSEGKTWAFDSQGMTGTENAACEAHGCRDKIISLK